jgi:hypothetical protein
MREGKLASRRCLSKQHSYENYDVMEVYPVVGFYQVWGRIQIKIM